MIAPLLATLLPGDGAFPAADTLPGLGARVAAAGGAVLALLPPEFATLDPAAREAVLRRIEGEHPAAFERLVAACYLAYYTDPAVRAVLAANHGYAAVPPQPAGHHLPPFDEALLARQRQRAPFWRDA